MSCTVVRLGTLLAMLPALLLAGCITDMFDPAGGRYARNRYSDFDAFQLKERRAGPDGTTVLVFQAKKPQARVWLRSVYLFNPGKNGPHLKYDLEASGQVRVALAPADFNGWEGITFFGGYKSPELAIAGARSVEIVHTYRFP